ncbi:YmdB family metallophosphoesterase [Oscillospiraceae bacterium OttesenSCG-928-F05]|nr:YmdB family metallophosphoesterase [Oscillospiraceae bacterium OttesenSCG-928-F05]
MMIRLLAVGDVVGESGMAFTERHLRHYKTVKGVDFTVVNAENAAGIGVLPDHCRRLYNAGADVLTLGNHAFKRKEILSAAEDDPYLLRPANMTSFNPGKGSGVFEGPRGLRILVMVLMGRTYFDAHLDNPFFCADRRLAAGDYDIAVADIHAEATSEKAALGYYLDGRCAAVFGTHTHVQTADEQILPKGTGYITDLGMTGPARSVLGIPPEQSIDRFLGKPPVWYKEAEGPAHLKGALFDIDEKTSKCLAVERVSIQ